MRIFGQYLSVAGLVALAIGAPFAAEAQMAKASTVKSVAIAASPGGADKWTCVSRAVVEIAPVSYDTTGSPSGWVRVHRVQGDIVAAERVSRLEIDQLRRLPCGTPDSDLGGVARVG
jgi:hypothetical protein